MFAPLFQVSLATANSLMAIEASRQVISSLPIDPGVLQGLRRTARLATVHYSTKIEGNRLTQEQVVEALAGAHFPHRERDEAEVRNYFKALERVEALAEPDGPIDETELRRVHGLVLNGRLADSKYRDGQNVIRDSASGGIVYMPPEAADVPGLMVELFDWINQSLDAATIPVPIVAALAHYQYATIHPYYDGNGRTARLLTTLVLHRAGYGLKGIYSLEEHYARDLTAYYAALTIGPSHNYYLGRAEAEISPFVEYFCSSMADAFVAVQAHTTEAAVQGRKDASIPLRRLDPRKRRILALFREQSTITGGEMAVCLGVSASTAGALARQWVKDGFFVVANESRKARSYQLSNEYEKLFDL